MKYLLTILLISICLQGNGQNLVPNPSFENYGTLPCSWIRSQTGFTNAIQNWFMPTKGSTDIFSTLVDINCHAHCISTSSTSIGQQLPRTGKVMSAILTYGTGCFITQPNYREYLEIQLTSPLIAGEIYYAEMYVSLADYSQHASNNIGMYFSDTLIEKPELCTELNFTPQINESSIITDSTNWVKISGTFVASSPAQYLIIGNFYNDSNTSTIYSSSRKRFNARYYIDDVVVKKSCFSISSDTTICQGDAITLYANSTSLIGWAIDTMPNKLITSDTILRVSPQNTTTYLVYSSCDTVPITVEVNPLPTVNLGNDTILCYGGTLTLDATTSNSNYLWQDNSTYPTFNVTQPGTYWVEVSNNCKVISDTLVVEIENCHCPLYIPNVFTPNNDGINDQFSPISNCDFSKYTLMIFNRWGEKMFESNFHEDSWDGTYRGQNSPNGVYVYLLTYRLRGNSETQTKYDNVTLIR